MNTRFFSIASILMVTACGSTDGAYSPMTAPNAAGTATTVTTRELTTGGSSSVLKTTTTGGQSPATSTATATGGSTWTATSLATGGQMETGGTTGDTDQAGGTAATDTSQSTTAVTSTGGSKATGGSPATGGKSNQATGGQSSQATGGTKATGGGGAPTTSTSTGYSHPCNTYACSGLTACQALWTNIDLQAQCDALNNKFDDADCDAFWTSTCGPIQGAGGTSGTGGAASTGESTHTGGSAATGGTVATGGLQGTGGATATTAATYTVNSTMSGVDEQVNAECVGHTDIVVTGSCSCQYADGSTPITQPTGTFLSGAAGTVAGTDGWYCRYYALKCIASVTCKK
jgi:hypothetical protein